jgi:spore coat-associated protein N
MKKIFLGIITIAMVTGLMVGGALAYFSDTETSTGNAFTAGTLDLVVNGENPWADYEFNVGPDVVRPGANGSQPINLRNSGTVSGLARIRIDVTADGDDENGVNEPENALGDTGPLGELDNNLMITVMNGSSTILSGYLSSINGSTYDIATLGASRTANLTLNWSVAGSVGNVIQTDICVFSIAVTLEQQP